MELIEKINQKQQQISAKMNNLSTEITAKINDNKQIIEKYDRIILIEKQFITQ